MTYAGRCLGPTATIPLVGLGTWDVRGDAVAPTIHTALAVGYRHIDTATGYGNEAHIGAAMEDVGLDRSDLFLTSKVAPRDVGREEAALEASLRGLRTEYLDLWLIHAYPGAAASPALWELLIAAREAGKVRAIGVSNYTTAQIDALTAATGVTPAVHQTRWRPSIFDARLLRESRERDIVLEGFSALRQSDLTHPALTETAARHCVTPAQVVLRWHVEHGVVALPRSTRSDRIAANFDVWDFALTADEVARIDAMNQATAADPAAPQRRGPGRPHAQTERPRVCRR